MDTVEHVTVVLQQLVNNLKWILIILIIQYQIKGSVLKNVFITHRIMFV